MPLLGAWLLSFPHTCCTCPLHQAALLSWHRRWLPRCCAGYACSHQPQQVRFRCQLRAWAAATRTLHDVYGHFAPARRLMAADSACPDINRCV